MAKGSDQVLRKVVLWAILAIVVVCVAMTAYAVIATLRLPPTASNPYEAQRIQPLEIPGLDDSLEIQEPEWDDRDDVLERDLLTLVGT